MSDQIQPSTSTHHHASLSNKEFYLQCVQVGSTAKIAVREFLALLPEAEDRQIYLEHGMSSIFEFAAKLGGISKEQVQRVLQLRTRFKDMPVMAGLLVSGEISVHKLARVASVVTPQNQQFWATQAQLLSSQALATVVKDSKAITDTDSVHMHSANPNKIAKIQKVEQSDELNLSPKIRQRLLALQNKGIDINQLLEELLDQREQQLQNKKEELAVKQISHTVSRHIPAKMKSVLKQEFGTKCAHSNCTNISTNIHHQQRFALDPRHNPIYLLPLCKQHHEIAHAIDIKSVKYKIIHLGWRTVRTLHFRSHR